MIKVDRNGDGFFETQLVSDKLLTAAEFVNGAGKVIICHLPPGNPSNAHRLSISRSALKAHLGHGDHEGECKDENKEEKKDKKKDGKEEKDQHDSDKNKPKEEKHEEKKEKNKKK